MYIYPLFQQLLNIGRHENLGDIPTDSGWLFRLAKLVR